MTASPPPGSPLRAPLPTAAPLWWSVLLLLPLVMLVYGPAALPAQFLAFDDNYYFGPDNPQFQAGARALLDPQQPIANVWLPVAHLSLYFDYWVGNGSPFLPHLHSLLLQALAAIVLARLLLRLGASAFVAHGAAALFAVHPALAESVAWVSGRKDVLSGLFVFAALHACVAHAERPRPARLLLVALFAALAMYSKATAVVLPLLVGAVLAVVGGDRRRWWSLVVAVLVVGPIAWHHQRVAAAEGTMGDAELAARLGQVPGAFLHYVGTTLWPLRLNVLYPEVDTLALFRAQLAPGAVAVGLAAVAVLGLWLRPATRLAALGLTTFVLALLPFNTAFPASSIAAADRYLYLALPGAGLVGALLLQRTGRAAWPLMAVLLLVVAYLGGSRAQQFRDDATLWTASLEVDPANAVAHLNLVTDRMRRGPVQVGDVRGQVEAAVAAARYPIHALRAQQLLVQFALLEADYPRAAAAARGAIAAAEAQLARERSPNRINEATALLLAAQIAAFEPLRLAGDEAGAEAMHRAAKALVPDSPDVVAFSVLRELAACAQELQQQAAAGKPARLADDDPRGLAADRVLAAALQQHPRNAGLLLAQAEWDRARDRVKEALRRYRQATQSGPERVDAWLGAARLMRERELFEEAAKFAREGLVHRPDPALRQELALALVGQGKLDDAELQLRAYLKLRPGDKDGGRILANLLTVRAYAKLAEAGTDPATIVRMIDEALVFNPDEARAQLVLGRLARQERRTVAAVRHFELAHAKLPQLAEARQGLVESLAAQGYECLLARNDDAAVTAWLRCVELAPEDFDSAEIKAQLLNAWGRYEARGLAALESGDRAAAAVAFRQCLRIAPDQHWAAWLLATVVHEDPAADLGELERLCRQALAWQEQHALDRSQQVLLLARTLLRAGRVEEGKALAATYLGAPGADAKPQVLAALKSLAGS